MLEEVLVDERLARRPTTAYVDLDALRHNLEAVRSEVGPRPKIMAIVKANAYGHGLVTTAKAFLRHGASSLGVAFLEEGIALRRAGVTAPILVLGGIIGNQVRHFLEHDLDVTAASPYKLSQIEAAARELGRRARVHLKVDTGMARLGVRWETSASLFEAAADSRHVDVVGIFSHLACAEDASSDFTALQHRRFLEALESARAAGLTSADAHLANSAGVFHHPETHFDMVRPGLALYGVGPRGPDPRLRPALRLETRVVFFKVVREGAPVSYDGTWVAPRDTRVVTLPVGYGDGYLRALSNKAYVVIRGRRRPVVGRVTMDATMVDLGPDGTGYNGDPVTLLGSGGDAAISAHELAEWADTIPYEILASIGARVPRVYVGA
jgi:alanine racemase